MLVNSCKRKKATDEFSGTRQKFREKNRKIRAESFYSDHLLSIILTKS